MNRKPLTMRLVRRAIEYRWDLAGMTAGIASLMLAALFNARKRPFWYDELATWTIATSPTLREVVSLVRDGGDANPPLYHILVRAWTVPFGTSEVSFRLFSAFCVALALAILWLTLRRFYETRAVALGMFAVFCGSFELLFQSSEARFYGLLTLLTAMATALMVRLGESPNPRRRTLVGNALAHAALSTCHLFGLLFSGSLLAALLAHDLIRRSFRPWVYATFAIGWVAYLPWIPLLRQQAALARHGWLAPPTLNDFMLQVQNHTVWVPVVLVAAALSHILRGELRETEGHPGVTPIAPRGSRLPVILGATALLAVPVLVFIVSRVGPPAFKGRYLLPSAIGWALVLTHVVAACTEGDRPFRWGDARRTRGWVGLAIAAIWVSLGAAIVIRPVAAAWNRPSAPHPEAALGDAATAAVPVVLESALDFWPLYHYASAGSAPYRYVLDSAAADADRHSFAVEFSLMRVYRRHGHMRNAIVESRDFLCGTDRFLVVHERGRQWFAMRIASDSAFVWTTLRGVGETGSLRMVERRPGSRSAACADTALSPGAPGQMSRTASAQASRRVLPQTGPETRQP